MKPKWPTVPLGEILTKSDEWIELKPEATYRQVTVRLWGKGVTLRGEVAGAEIAAPKQRVVHARQFIASRIDARNGAFGLIPDSLEGAIVTSDFPVFSLNDTRMQPEYLHWLSKTGSFVELCKAASEGTTNRVRLKEDRFLALEIPLPPVTEQRRIVARIEQLATQIEEARRLRHHATEETEALLNSQLSAMVAELEKRGGSRKLQGLLLDACYGTSTKCSYDRADGSVPVLRIPNVASERVNFNDLKFGILSDPDLEKALVREGDILVVRTNGSADLVGRCAVVPSPSAPTAFASYMIRLRCDDNVVSPAYLQLMLKHLRTTGGLIDFARTTAGQYNVSLGRLRNASLPVPSLPEQRWIVGYLDGLAGPVAALARPDRIGVNLQSETAAELDALLPAVLDKAFKGEL